MSAPTTNIETQKRRHAGALRWIALATGAVAIMAAVTYAMAVSEDDRAADVPAAISADS